MRSPYLRSGAASVAMALGKMEDIFQNQRTKNKQNIFPATQHSDLLVYANFIQENTTILGNSSAEDGMKLCANAPIAINETAKNRFLSILGRLIKAHEGVSRQERLFVHRFWSEIQRTLFDRNL